MMEDGRWRLEVVTMYCRAVCGGVTDDQLTAGRCGVRTLLLISQQRAESGLTKTSSTSVLCPGDSVSARAWPQ